LRRGPQDAKIGGPAQGHTNSLDGDTTPESFGHGGYETYRTVYTSRLAKDAGERILRDSVELLHLAHGQYDKNKD
jgi:hypothetical protein